MNYSRDSLLTDDVTVSKINLLVLFTGNMSHTVITTTNSQGLEGGLSPGYTWTIPGL